MSSSTSIPVPARDQRRVRGLRRGIEGISAVVSRPASQAIGTTVWGATGGAVARATRFYLATDELARSGDSGRQAEVQKRRLLGTTAGVALAGPGTWLAELAATGACEFLSLTYGPWAAVLAAAEYGLRRGRATLRMLKTATPEVVGADGTVLPIRPLIEARSEHQAMDYLRRALLAEKVVTEAAATVRAPWGWELTVRLLEITPAELRKKLPALEVRLDMSINKLLAQPHADQAARVTLRAVLCDPWADMPPLAPYAPTRSGRDRIALAVRLDAVGLGISLSGGTHAVVLGASGSGKSILLRVIVDAIAAATDAVLCDLDPSGVGQAPQRKAFSLVALSPQDCAIALYRLVRIAKARTRLLGRHGWDEWKPSKAQPAIVALIDEFPQLSKEGKALAIALLRIARKAGMSLVFAAQTNTKSALGEAISGQVAIKAAGAGLQRWEMAALFGEQAVAAGWDTQALRPKKGALLNDTGTWLIEGAAEGDQALYARAHYLSNETAKARVDSYQAAGERAVIDDETLTWAGLTREQFEALLTDDAAAMAAVQASEAFTPEAGDDEPEQIEPMPAVLIALASVLEDSETGLVATAELAARVSGYDATSLGKALARAGVERHNASGKARVNGGTQPVSVWSIEAIHTAIATYAGES